MKRLIRLLNIRSYVSRKRLILLLCLIIVNTKLICSVSPFIFNSIDKRNKLILTEVLVSGNHNEAHINVMMVKSTTSKRKNSKLSKYYFCIVTILSLFYNMFCFTSKNCRKMSIFSLLY